MVLHIVVHKSTNKPIQIQDEDGDKKTLIFNDRHKAEVFMQLIDEKVASCYTIRLYKSLTGTVNVTKTVNRFQSIADVRAENQRKLEAEKLRLEAERIQAESSKYVGSKRAMMYANQRIAKDLMDKSTPDFLR